MRLGAWEGERSGRLLGDEGGICKMYGYDGRRWTWCVQILHCIWAALWGQDLDIRDGYEVDLSLRGTYSEVMRRRLISKKAASRSTRRPRILCVVFRAYIYHLFSKPLRHNRFSFVPFRTS